MIRTHRFFGWLALLIAGLAQAAASAAQQVPGYYVMPLGSAKVVALLDGFYPLSLKELSGIDPKTAAALTEADHVPQTPDGLRTAFNAYLVDMGTRRVLIDAGTSQCFGPTLGKIPEQLRAAGYDPADVDEVLITHAHPDHLCGIADAAGQPLYPRATVWLAQEDAAYWLDPESEKSAKPFFKPLFAMARKATQAYADQGRLKRFKTDDAMPAGISLIPTHGHTPGHSSYLVDGGDGHKLLVWGDIVHYHAVQFAHPEAVYAGDKDPAQARAQRAALFRRASEQHWWVAGAHLPFPGIGHLNREGSAYRWVPAEFAPVP